MKILDKNFEVFIASEEIEKRVLQLAAEISKDFRGQDPVIIPILNGAFLFASDLVKEMSIPCQLSFIKVSSYHGTESSGIVTTLLGLDIDLKDRSVILVDDIVDTGLTMYSIIEEVKKYKPRNIQTVSLLLKPEALQKNLHVKYVGFTIPNNFVVGYGLDYEGYGRNLKEIYKIVDSPQSTV